MSARLASSSASERIRAAKETYAGQQLAGSDHKDVWASLQFWAAGAFIDSSLETVRDGHVLIGCPPEKRLAFSYASLKACALSCTSQELAACLSGSWISVLMYRRPLMSCLGSFFGLGQVSDPGSSENALIPFSRKEAQELAVLASVSPLIVCNLAAPFSGEMFCSDASIAKGAVCTAKIDLPTFAARVLETSSPLL